MEKEIKEIVIDELLIKGLGHLHITSYLHLHHLSIIFMFNSNVKGKQKAQCYNYDSIWLLITNGHRRKR